MSTEFYIDLEHNDPVVTCYVMHSSWQLSIFIRLDLWHQRIQSRMSFSVQIKLKLDTKIYIPQTVSLASFWIPAFQFIMSFVPGVYHIYLLITNWRQKKRERKQRKKV